MEVARFLWLFVFFDLPTKTKKDRYYANKFRRFLLSDGYMKIQLSIYARVCIGQDAVSKHTKRIEISLPPVGRVRMLQVTDRQYARMKILRGNTVKNEEQGTKQLLLF